MLMQSAGAIAGVTVTAASGIEIALWDLCGRILETPACNLPGGSRFRDKVRFYRTMQVVDRVDDPASWRAKVQQARSEKWGSAHNAASPVGTAASAHAAASMRDFRVHELANYVDWWPDLVVREGPFWENGYFVIPDKPGYGIEPDPDVAKAHLAPGEKYW